MIRPLYALIFCIAISNVTFATPSSSKAHEHLLAQVQRLIELLRHDNETGNPEDARIQFAKRGEHEELALVLFTTEPVYGNNYEEYFAVFFTDSEARHYSLVDVVHIGGKLWRSITDARPKVISNKEAGGTLIILHGLESDGDDPLCCPTKKIQIRLLLKKGRLIELGSQ